MLQFFNKGNDEKGFTLLELVIATAIIGVLMPLLIRLADMGLETLSQKNVGEHLARVSKAAREYTLANYTALQGTSTNTVGTVVPFATLIADGHLPANFRVTNGWGQAYQIYVLEPNAGNLQTIVLTTGGRDQTTSSPGFADRMVPNAAANAGATGGYIPTGNVPGEANTVLQGALGGWTFTFAGTNVPNPGTGHLGSMQYFSAADIDASDYLHRVAVPGAPELNAMTVNLDMDGNTILMGGTGDLGGGDNEGVGSINFEDLAVGAYACANNDDVGGRLFFNDTEGLFLCRQGQLHRINDTGNSGGFQSAGIVSHGDIIPKPACSTARPTPRIYFSTSMASENDVFRPIQAIQPWAVDNGDGTWTTNFQLMANGDYINPDPAYGRILALLTCEP